MARHFYNNRAIRASQTGFTLIEILVVLIIVAMVSSILFEALERAYRLQERFGTELFSVQQGQMATDWYRQTIHGLQPDYADGNHVFQGSDHEFSGLSNNPLSDAFGAPTPIAWKIRDNQQNGTTELLYMENNHETPILSWRGQAQFVYFDDKQAPSDIWPPLGELSTQLPKQIQLVISDAVEPVDIVAARMGPAAAPTRIQNVFGVTP